jgi:Helix-turn-helix domain
MQTGGVSRLPVWANATQYNGAAQQRERILARLRQGPATRSELQYGCRAPSVTKRISELRRDGWRIESEWIREIAPDGSLNRTMLYRLCEEDDEPQAGLFEAP